MSKGGGAPNGPTDDSLLIPDTSRTEPLPEGTGSDKGDAGSRKPKQLEMSRRFREQAIGELRAADLLLQPAGYHVAVRQAHLAVEMGLKSLLWRHVGRGERGHNLLRLLDKVEVWVGTAPATMRDGLSNLQTTAGVASYPDSSMDRLPHEISGEDAANCVMTAREALSWIDSAMANEEASE